MYLFLEQSRVVGMLDLPTKDLHSKIEQWWRDYEAPLNFTGNPTSTGRLLAEMVKVRQTSHVVGGSVVHLFLTLILSRHVRVAFLSPPMNSCLTP